MQDMIRVSGENYIQDGAKGWVKFGDYYLHETFRQVYGGNNAIIAGGKLHGYEVAADTVYLWIQKDGIDPAIVFLRTDEALAIVLALSDALWTIEMNGENFVPELSE